jgi:hypothetical protein
MTFKSHETCKATIWLSPTILWKKHSKFFCWLILNFFVTCFMPIITYIVTKKRASENTQHTDCLQRTHASMFSWSTPHSSTFDHTQHTSCLLILSYEHYKIKDVQVLCFHTTTEQILQYPSPASPTHTNANKRNFLITLQTIYIPWKHKLAFHQMFTITPDSQWCLVSLSWVPLQ